MMNEDQLIHWGFVMNRNQVISARQNPVFRVMGSFSYAFHD